MSQAYRESLWLFTATQSLHLVAVTTFIGAILIVDLRLLGWGPVRQSRADIAWSAQRILLWAGLAVLATGIPQFTANARATPRSPVFVFKMCLLAATVVSTATVRRRVGSPTKDACRRGCRGQSVLFRSRCGWVSRSAAGITMTADRLSTRAKL